MPRPSTSTQPRLVSTPATRRALHRFPLPPLPLNDAVKSQMERIVASRTFSGAHRSQLFLRYILHHAVVHPDEQLKEYGIAIDVFDRDSSYDPAVNNTVRVEAGRLRSRLLQYYSAEGQTDPLLIEVPKGSYRALIRARQPVAVPASASAQMRIGKPLPRSASGHSTKLWAVSVAFLLGAFVGYRASH